MAKWTSSIFVSLSLLASTAIAAAPLRTTPVPVVLWHGLGDRFEYVQHSQAYLVPSFPNLALRSAPGLLELKTDLEERPELEGVFVWIVRLAGEDGTGDQRATFFGSANEQVALVCDQLRALPEIMDPLLNPSGKFDAIGFSQGGQLLRAVVERCGGEGGLNVRNLITVGSQHMGVSAMPPCPPGSSPFGACRLMHLSVVREGIYSSFAQNKIIPAQYFRDEARIDDYLAVNTFLKDINNERVGDRQVNLPDALGEDDKAEPRNATYKANFASLTNLVLLRFSDDATVVPPQSAHFTLPSPYADNCDPLEPACYLDPLPYSYLPLFASDYIGLRVLDRDDKIHLGVCDGQHMQISDACWNAVASWLGAGDGKVRAPRRPEVGRLVVQL
ncbi:hypothetical protein RQP46_004734 [Phenoliferia psychrophenolica]